MIGPKAWMKKARIANGHGRDRDQGAVSSAVKVMIPHQPKPSDQHLPIGLVVRAGTNLWT
jgi:hypothetical protein